LDQTFWRETLGLSAEELEAIKRSAPLHNEFSRKDLEQFQRWFYFDISIRIQEWRGGYTHIDIHGPLEERHSTEMYRGPYSRASLWTLCLPSRAGEIMGPCLCLLFDGSYIRLHCSGGRFGWLGFGEQEPAPENIFFTVPLVEGPAVAVFHKPDYKIEIWEDVYKDVDPWQQCYQDLDIKRGLAWQLWIHDCDLFARSEGSCSKANHLLLADYRRIAANFYTTKERKAYYERLAGDLEARIQRVGDS
jgi:hypothetical protein